MVHFPGSEIPRGYTSRTILLKENSTDIARGETPNSKEHPSIMYKLFGIIPLRNPQGITTVCNTRIFCEICFHHLITSSESLEVRPFGLKELDDSLTLPDCFVEVHYIGVCVIFLCIFLFQKLSCEMVGFFHVANKLLPQKLT